MTSKELRILSIGIIFDEMNSEYIVLVVVNTVETIFTVLAKNWKDYWCGR